MKVKSESEVAQSCPTPSNLMDCSLPGSSVHGIFQARALEWDASALLFALRKCAALCERLSFFILICYHFGFMLDMGTTSCVSKAAKIWWVCHCGAVSLDCWQIGLNRKWEIFLLALIRACSTYVLFPDATTWWKKQQKVIRTQVNKALLKMGERGKTFGKQITFVCKLKRKRRSFWRICETYMHSFEQLLVSFYFCS